MSNTVLHLPRNTAGRDLLVGDIHGCVSLLEQELERVGFDPETDRVIAVGDLVDRGPESELINFLLLQSWFYSTLGNHDVSCAARLIDPEHWQHWETPYSHPWATSLEEDHLGDIQRHIARLPWVIEIDTVVGLVGVVHATVPEIFSDWASFKRELDGPRALELRGEAVWSRTLHRLSRSTELGSSEDEATDAAYHLDGVAHVVHGHSPADDYTIHRLANRFWIDCGAYEAAGRPDLAARLARPPRMTLVDAMEPGSPL